MTHLDASAILDPVRLDQLLDSYGIASEFIEFSGSIAHISLENRLHILGTMGIEVDSPDALERLLETREWSEIRACVPPVLTAGEGEVRVPLTLEPADLKYRLHWQVILEEDTGSSAPRMPGGDIAPADLPLLSTRELGGREFQSRQLTLPAMPSGYHRLIVRLGSARHESLLICAPSRAWQAQSLLDGKRLWGLSAQLYSLRSAQNWGMGDFADLASLVDQSAAEGAHFILLNPLHALDLRYPENASPYSPSDRRFLNPLYIALPDCEDYQAADVQALLEEPGHAQELERLRSAPDVDYAGVHRLKLAFLVRMFRSFMQRHVSLESRRARQFRAFSHKGGEALQLFAAMQARQNASAGAELGLPEFHVYLQWLSQEQLRNCHERALALGMPLGLVRDLAVGSSVDGCEVQGNPGLFCTAARIGAPPDNFNPDGQNWGLPPLHPEALKASEFRHFVDLLRANMYACGALRIDHVMSLMRLWWCPDDGSNASGAYVHYPVDVLFAILRLESCRNRCLVIGEDLGVVPPAIRNYLDHGGIYSNSVFYFEKYDGWHFRKPHDYKVQALAMIANHDVPPLRAWWNGGDLLLRRQIGLIPDDEQLLAGQQYRQGEKGQILQWLAEQNLLPAGWQDRNVERALDTELFVAIAGACARVSAQLLSFQLDDLAGVDTPVNIPGTSDEYANWRRKIPVALEDVFTNTVSRSLLQALRENRSA